MSTQVTIDRCGRIRIPKAIRARLGLFLGTTLVVKAHDDNEIRLRSIHENLLLWRRRAYSWCNPGQWVTLTG